MAGSGRLALTFGGRWTLHNGGRWESRGSSGGGGDDH